MTSLSGNPDHVGRTIEVDMVTRADPERIWDAWTNPERLVQWFADRASGSIHEGHVTWTFDRLKSAMAYQVLDQVPGERLLLGNADNNSRRLEIRISPEREGTGVRIIHSGFGDAVGEDEDFTAADSSWRIALPILRYYAEFHFGQKRETFFVLRPARFSLPRLAQLYRDPAGLQEWLSDGGSLGTPGGRVHLALKSGETLRGDMLADTGVELAMAWDEIGGVLQFKTCTLPDEIGMRAVYLHGWGWGISPEQAMLVERRLAEAVDRLERALDHVEADGAGVSSVMTPSGSGR